MFKCLCKSSADMNWVGTVGTRKDCCFYLVDKGVSFFQFFSSAFSLFYANKRSAALKYQPLCHERETGPSLNYRALLRVTWLSSFNEGLMSYILVAQITVQVQVLCFMPVYIHLSSYQKSLVC